jgi:7-cyano-7-deazaguanine synthase in queuosine biosynthesis
MQNKITLADVAIEICEGPLGISASGGADSSLLLYILMKYTASPIHIFTCSSKQKHRVAPHIVSNVIAYCIDAHQFKYPVYHHVYFVETQTRESWENGMANINSSLKLSSVYTATTANPPLIVTNLWKNGDNGLSSRRDPGITRPTIYYNSPISKTLHVPMVNVDKLKVKQIYDELGLTDTLFPITRSCESLVLNSGHCGECWWCQERYWAFGKLE